MNNLANEILPPQSGFFFGNTDIDEWYMTSLKETFERLEFILSNKEIFKDIDFEYSSSW